MNLQLTPADIEAHGGNQSRWPRRRAAVLTSICVKRAGDRLARKAQVDDGGRSCRASERATPAGGGGRKASGEPRASTRTTAHGQQLQQQPQCRRASRGGRAARGHPPSPPGKARPLRRARSAQKLPPWSASCRVNAPFRGAGRRPMKPGPSFLAPPGAVGPPREPPHGVDVARMRNPRRPAGRRAAGRDEGDRASGWCGLRAR
eukprot:scaffold3695_cov398-Prasinococcus_capsulatus_cf.AAC.9